MYPNTFRGYGAIFVDDKVDSWWVRKQCKRADTKNAAPAKPAQSRNSKDFKSGCHRKSWVPPKTSDVHPETRIYKQELGQDYDDMTSQIHSKL